MAFFRKRSMFDWSTPLTKPTMILKFLNCQILQPWESAAAFGNVVANAVLCWFYDGKKCCWKGFHICCLSFQVLQCWRFNLDSISLTILLSQYQCCLFARFTAILVWNQEWLAANDCQFFQPHRLEGSPWLLTLTTQSIG